MMEENFDNNEESSTMDAEESIRSKDKSFLSAADEEMLNESLMMRRTVSKILFNNGNPDIKAVRLLNEVLTGSDTLILKKAESRLKHSENKNNQAVAASLAVATLHAIRSGKVPTEALTVGGKGEIPVLPKEFLDVAVVDGELEIGATALDIEDFVKNSIDEE